MVAIALGPRVWRIPTAGDFINSFAFEQDDGSVTLVDTGVSRASKRIVAGLAQIGKHPGDVQRIILTHAHSDHAGSAAALLPQTSADGTVVHAEDAHYVEAGQAAPASGLGKIMQRLPGMGFAAVPVTHQAVDGELLEGGLRVHHTPGHTPGHMSLVHEPTGILITGDCIFNMAGRMTWPVRAFCTDFPLNQNTAATLADLEYSIAAFTHGPHLDERAREQVRGFLRRRGVVR